MMDEYKSGWAARAANEPNDEIIKSGKLPRFVSNFNFVSSVNRARLLVSVCPKGFFLNRSTKEFDHNPQLKDKPFQPHQKTKLQH